MTLFRRLLRILTLRCREASVLTSRALDEPLPMPEQLALRGHQLVCGSCREMARQFQLIQLGAQQAEQANATQSLAPETVERIRQAVREASADESAPP